jgi:hypothetical protein
VILKLSVTILCRVHDRIIDECETVDGMKNGSGN